MNVVVPACFDVGACSLPQKAKSHLVVPGLTELKEQQHKAPSEDYCQCFMYSETQAALTATVKLLLGEIQNPRVPVGCIPVLMTSKFTASFANPNSSTAKQTHSCFSWSQSSMVALQHVYLHWCWFPLFPVDQRSTLIDSRFWKQNIWIIENIKLLHMVKNWFRWQDIRWILGKLRCNVCFRQLLYSPKWII